ncbi:MAG TPA: 16S rRNA (adenine(1518)-N(6)/adenine(1519)-N(6))-dimethyltransferase RsmA [Bacteroidia bacterium]|nr:16S rRNA (adenine(1518)-N(6)/adenine(1519)-N(6))-dimethyltransferase RsmA [Bacteroidia bacterium]
MQNKQTSSGVRAKKNLGQHFLKDPAIAERIVGFLGDSKAYTDILEIGPGMGILTDFLFEKKGYRTRIVDLDEESITYLNNRFPLRQQDIIHADFLQMDFDQFFKGQFAIIGNFPYNISSQILFKVLDDRDRIPEVVGMFQKEVAMRIAGDPGSKEYGILSVFMQAYFDVNIVLQLNENDFQPPPKVKSTVLHFLRKDNFNLGCDEKEFRKTVKTAFNQRRKTLRNAMGTMVSKDVEIPFSGLRAEALSWQKFVELTNFIIEHRKSVS